jgi:hypothetical protein
MIVAAFVLAQAAAAGPQLCVPCHARQVSGFLETGMGRSMSAAGDDWAGWDSRLGATRFRVEGRRQSIERSGFRAADAPAGEAISCERCHGAVDKHLREPGPGTIVNPARLAAPLRDAVCEQCHLGGEARILNPGRTWHDWSPGQALEDTFAVYVGAPPSEFKVVSHVEQLAQSRCSIGSQGRLWCGTCHDPHAKPVNAAAHYRARCVSCHVQTKHRAAEASGDCAGCHMARRRAPDSGHAAFTDHLIRRRPQPERQSEGPRQLRAWREPAGALARRSLGLAYAAAGEKRQSVELLTQAGRILSGIPVDSADAETLAALGLVRLLQDRPEDAVLLLERAVAARPRWASYYQTLALAWRAAGNPKRAAAVLDRAIEIDPSIEALYHTRAGMESGAARRAVLERYLRVAPKSIVTREALAVHLRQ